MDEQLKQQIEAAINSGALTEDSLRGWITSQDPQVFEDTLSDQSQFLDALNSSTIGRTMLLTQKLFDALPKVYEDSAVLKARKEDMKQAQAQLEQAQAREDALTAPDFTQPTASTEEFQRGIEQAERDATTAGITELGALQQELRRGYNRDIQQAKTTSTGQAGNIQNQAQLAANRRNRGLRDISLVRNQLRQQALGRADSLRGQKANVEMANDRLRQSSDFLRERRYQNEIDRIEALGATARENIRNARYNMIPARRNIMNTVGGLVQQGLGMIPINQGAGQTMPNPVQPMGIQPTAPPDLMAKNFGPPPNMMATPEYQFMQTPDYSQGPQMAGKAFQGTFSRSNPYINPYFTD